MKQIIEKTPGMWRSQAEAELVAADGAWAEHNAGMARVASRRGAGMCIRAWLMEVPREGYGTNFMHALRAMADDESIPPAPREAAWRLAARPVPEAGWIVPLAGHLKPMDDARLLMGYCRGTE